jgi:hypothetical protein
MDIKEHLYIYTDIARRLMSISLDIHILSNQNRFSDEEKQYLRLVHKKLESIASEKYDKLIDIIKKGK